MAGPSRPVRLRVLLVLLSCLVVLLIGLWAFQPPETLIMDEPTVPKGPTTAWIREPASPPSSAAATARLEPVKPLPIIDPRTPLAQLLPSPPKVKTVPVYLGQDLQHVPELKLEAPPAEELTMLSTLSTQEWTSRKEHTAAAALHLNAQEEDGFLKALVRTRADLSGLPFVMGDACRTSGPRARAFREMAGFVRRGEGEKHLATQRYHQAHAALAAQVQPEEGSTGLKDLTALVTQYQQPDAIRELFRLAVFSPDDTARRQALTSLKACKAADTQRIGKEVLLAGLRYPWPDVTRNAVKAVVELERTDLIAQLEAMLDEPDPRAPVVIESKGKDVTVAREVVRINHHRNCLLCHAPAESGKTPPEALVVPVPLPSEPLPPTALYYSPKERATPAPHLLVRVDVTYLRQDFSAIHPVYDSSVWRVMQRFDYVARNRVLTAEEARELRTRLAKASPYRDVIAEALRGLARKGS